jgi:hypothetical protein
MERFYTYLLEGHGKADALRLAQLDVRAEYPHPYNWAGFILSGDAGEVTAIPPVVAGQPGVMITPTTPTETDETVAEATPKPEDNASSRGGICFAAALPLGLILLVGQRGKKRATSKE